MIINAILSLDDTSTLAGAVEQVQQLERAGATAVVLEAVSDRALPGSDAATLFEPDTLAGYLARRTSTIGLVPMDTALYGFPYHLARRFCTLDHLSGGRAGWAARTWTAPREVASFDWRSTEGRAMELHRATEFTEIALELWDCWEPGAQVPNKATGEFKDDSRIHRIEYRSTTFMVRGPLDTPRSPQGRPVLYTDVHAEEDIAYAASFADVVTLRAATMERAQQLISKLRIAADGTGRGEQLKVMPVLARGESTTVLPLSSGTDAVSEALGVVEALGADGLSILVDPAPEAMRWLVGEFIPALALDEALADTGSDTLAGRLGLDGLMAFGRRVA